MEKNKGINNVATRINDNHVKWPPYYVSPSPGSDVSMPAQHVCVSMHCFCGPEPVSTISLGACDLELRFAKHATSLPGDSETEYII